MDWLKNWWRTGNNHLPLFGRITDLAASVPRYNRALQFRATRVSGTTTFNPDNTRVGIAVFAEYTPAVQAAEALLRIQVDAAGSQIFLGHTIIAKEADTAAVTPSPFTYNPLVLTVLDIGPMIQQFIVINISSGSLAISLVELLVNPSLDDQIDG